MLDIGVAAALEQLGFEPHATALCEWEAYAASILLERMEVSALEPCPIWCGDLRDFDGKPFRGVVDVIAAGLPCQPYSVAGKQLGLVDRRSYGEDGEGPIPQFLRIVSECLPAVVFCENVPPWILRGYFRPVGDELSRMGYTIEDPLFVTAESVGASHKRERVFVMAHATGQRWREAVSSKAGRRSDNDKFGDDVATPEASQRAANAGRKHDNPSSSRGGQSNLADNATTWPTPYGVSGNHGPDGNEFSTFVRNWATPDASSDERGTTQRPKSSRGKTINWDVANWPTPAARDYRDDAGTESQSNRNTPNLSHACLDYSLPDQTPTGEAYHRKSGRRLNPAFVCWLMGLPWWWTHPERINSAAVAMDAYRSKLRSLLSSYFQKQ